jgi:outer membrane protein TolC
MRIPTLLLIAVVVTPLMAPAGPQEKADPPPKKKAEDPAKKIKELQKERIDTLKELVDSTTELFKTARGAVKYEDVLEAHLLLLKAQLEAEEKESDRIALYRKTVDVLKNYEKFAQRQVAAGRTTQPAVLKIKARRLEVEIQLEKEKAKERK